MPCLGIADKHNKQLSSFLQFVTKRKPNTNGPFTANQKSLSEISLKQHEIAKNYDGLPGKEARSGMVVAKRDLFGLWREAFPLLVQEKFCYTYYLYWLKFLNDKPRKAAMRICRFSEDKPVLSFLLKFHGDHFSLVAEVTVNGEVLVLDRKPHFFVFNDKTGLCYLMQSVQDDDLLMWIHSNNKRLTVLKEHFFEFHHTFLDQLSRCYGVNFMNVSGKKKKYVFNDLVEETALR